ncbi:hypothetical protein L5515_000875 [Caenorhabditis briggsae]|uniref:Uncharacterized protein n=1 Tax=Caenorhabditis briggsae TaxID=6238 RepID=A0AAE9E2X3_CAEBR|nr:hypothetical protein L5515_000875 [Caenorhabditis briggsae]
MDIKQILLSLTLIVSVADSRGRRINIYGAENGHSDIVQLRGNSGAQQVYSSPIREKIKMLYTVSVQ